MSHRGILLAVAVLGTLAAQAQTVIAPRNTTVIAPARPTTPPGTIAPATPPPAAPVVGTAQHAPGAAAAQSIKTERLICCGGDLRFERYPGFAPIPNANYHTIAENVALARSYPGGDYPPASKPADARSIPEWLRHLANYWRFEVCDSRRGYLVALDHGLWERGPTTLSDAGTEKPVTEIGRVMNIKITPFLRDVQLGIRRAARLPGFSQDCIEGLVWRLYQEGKSRDPPLHWAATQRALARAVL